MTVTLARLWGVSPAEVRECTHEEIEAMWTVLQREADRDGETV